ncbi:MAG: hypothetical protein HZA15_01100 [Nitrospirae bacterium]|nr:hypothetical protein [Nitrospirota bacterium]
MKKILIIIAFFLFSSDIFAFDISGLQPVSPYGVFSTFSSESLPKSKTSIELSLERSRERDFYRVQFKGAYGLTDHFEVMLTVPYVYDYLGSVDGVEDIAIGFKHRFYDEGKYGPSLAYIAAASLPVGHEGLTSGGRTGIGLILSKRLGPFRGNFNISYEQPGKDSLQDEILFASGIEFSATHDLDILAEFFARKVHFSKEYDQLEARLGYRLKTSDYIYTTVGIGADFKARSPEYRLLLSVSFTNVKGKNKVMKIYEEE